MFNFWPFKRKSYITRDILAEIISGTESSSGKNVTTETALKVATVFACSRVISEGVAQVPFKLFRANGNIRLPALDHSLYSIVHTKPNDSATSFELIEAIAIHACLAGESFCFINRRRGKVLELINLEPSSVSVDLSGKIGERPKYSVKNKDGVSKEFTAESILHIRGPRWGESPIAPVKYAREAIGLSIGLEESTSRLHKNGIKTGGLYSVDGTLTDQQYKDLRKWLAEEYEGSSNAHKSMILDRGAKYVPTAMTSIDAQQLESRRFQIEEVCRYFRVLPIMVCSTDKATTYASAEQMFLHHVVHTLTPWYVRIENAFNCQVLTEEERKAGYYVKFVTQGLLRGALKDTADYLAKLVNIGVMTRNEARELLEFNPIDGLDEPLTPLNMVAGEDKYVAET